MDKLPRASFFALLLVQRLLQKTPWSSGQMVGRAIDYLSKARELTNLVACLQDYVAAARGETLDQNDTLEELANVSSLVYSSITPFVTLHAWNILSLGSRAKFFFALTDATFMARHLLLLAVKDQDQKGHALEFLNAIGEAVSFELLPWPLQYGVGLVSGSFGLYRSWPEIGPSS